MSKSKTQSVAIESVSKIADLMLLFKFRLSLLVVFTAVIGYVIAAGVLLNWVDILMLGLGGFFVTWSANSLNQVLEKEFDHKMDRTRNRPLPTGRMSVSEAVIFAGLLAVAGLLILALFNPLTALLGSLSLVSYAFVYTPLKRYHSISVFVGAIPGALPAVIGFVAFNGALTPLALVLFSIQFMWQLPHFWSIGWLSFDDYNRAGFKLLPNMENGLTRQIGLNAFIFAVCLIPISILPIWIGQMSIWAMVIVACCGLYYALKSFDFYRYNNVESARKLMFASFLYLPVVFLIIMIDNF